MVILEKKNLLLPRFLVKNAKTTFLKINGFGVKYFIKSKYRRIQTGLAILKTFDCFQTIDFYTIFKNRSFPRFLKSISRTRETHYKRLILCKRCRQNPTKLVLSIQQRKKYLTASHFRFQCQNLRINFTASIDDFLNFISRTVTSCKKQIIAENFTAVQQIIEMY